MNHGNHQHTNTVTDCQLAKSPQLLAHVAQSVSLAQRTICHIRGLQIGLAASSDRTVTAIDALSKNLNMIRTRWQADRTTLQLRPLLRNGMVFSGDFEVQTTAVEQGAACCETQLIAQLQNVCIAGITLS